jgi:hypothetical protein
MSVDTVFTVPKDRLSVTIRLDKGVTLEGEIFLEPVAVDLSLHQKIVAFLETGNAFFPLKLDAAGKTEFINTKNVWILDITVPEGRDGDYFSFRPMHSVSVSMHFCDGKTVSGELMAEVSEERARLSDCLNLPGRFLSVKLGRKMRYINKDALQKVVYAGKP